MTTAEYRLIYFSPDPFLGGRVPVAALLKTGDGVTAVVPKSAPAALGDSKADFLLRVALRNVAPAASIDRLPSSLGPHFSLADSTRGIPRNVPSAESWLEQQLSNRREGSGVKRGPRVATEGRRFLEKWGVADSVQNNFAPKYNLLEGYAGRLQPITHYVLGRELLLLEPIHARAPERKLWEISTRFGAYRKALDDERLPIKTSLISYVLPGTRTSSERQEIARHIAFADFVIDAQSESECRRLVEKIRAAA